MKKATIIIIIIVAVSNGLLAQNNALVNFIDNNKASVKSYSGKDFAALIDKSTTDSIKLKYYDTYSRFSNTVQKLDSIQFIKGFNDNGRVGDTIFQQLKSELNANGYNHMMDAKFPHFANVTALGKENEPTHTWDFVFLADNRVIIHAMGIIEWNDISSLIKDISKDFSAPQPIQLRRKE